MAQTGVMSVDRAAGGEHPAVVKVYLFGPRGGFIGSTYIDHENAMAAYRQLRKVLGKV